MWCRAPCTQLWSTKRGRRETEKEEETKKQMKGRKVTLKARVLRKGVGGVGGMGGVDRPLKAGEVVIGGS